MSDHAVLMTVLDEPGMMHRVTRVLADLDVNITHIDLRTGSPETELYLEVSVPDGRLARMLEGLGREKGVREVVETQSASRIYGKRIVVIGGGAQVGQVALGAIAEADRHNIRGERISVDTIPLVGEQELATAVRTLTRLPRVEMLVLAGALMGGEIAAAVRDVRAQGLRVISLNMAGSAAAAADLIVTDPVQAGVLAVMAVADTAQFDLMRQTQRRY